MYRSAPVKPAERAVASVRALQLKSSPMSESAWATDLKDQACLRFSENTEKITACLRFFNDETIWDRANQNSLSIANQLLHLSGNITQYAISSLGGKPDVRQRDLEFSATGGLTKEQVVNRFLGVIAEATRAIRECPESDLLRIREVQGFSLTGIGIIMHVVEHYSYHTGQVVAWTKQRENQAMGFYDNVDLNTPNKG